MAMLPSNHEAVSQINVTPLIDVLLVLLIIFMLIVPSAPKGLHAALPQPSKSATDAGDAIVVQVLADGAGAASYRINSTGLPKAALEPRLAEIFATREDKVLFVRGDPKLTFNQMAEVVDLGRRAGVEQIAILTPGSEAAR